MTQSTTSAEADVAAGGRGLAKLNPHPQKAYQITLTIQGAPGPFAVVDGAAQYDVSNEEQCGNINSLTGTAGRITSMEDFALEKVTDTEYRGIFYSDLMQDDNYYGRGICHWGLTGASVALRATGANGETYFSSRIDLDEILASRTIQRHYARLRYPRSQTDDFQDSGHEDPDRFKPELRDELFSISVSAKELAQ